MVQARGDMDRDENSGWHSIADIESMDTGMMFCVPLPFLVCLNDRVSLPALMTMDNVHASCRSVKPSGVEAFRQKKCISVNIRGRLISQAVFVANTSCLQA